MPAECAAATPAERRRAARRVPAVGEPVRRVRSRTGRELDVIDISDAGLLIEGQPRLLPNTHLDIHVVTRAGRVLVRCRVVRAYVWYLEADLVRYRAGLAFDRPIDTSPGYPVPGPFAAVLTERGSDYPSGTGPAQGPGKDVRRF